MQGRSKQVLCAVQRELQNTISFSESRNVLVRRRSMKIHSGSTIFHCDLASEKEEKGCENPTVVIN